MRSSRSTLRSLALLLALTGVLFRGLIPAGFMPAMSADAGSLLVLCSGGTLRTAVDPDGAPAAQAMDECPFAAAASPGLPPAPLMLAVRREFGVSGPVAAGTPHLSAASRTRPPARAPPSFA